jgi:hypothetical protein
MLVPCRCCGVPTDRGWRPGSSGRVVRLCLACQGAWLDSGEKWRADELAGHARKDTDGVEETTQVITDGIYKRAMFDFTYRKQKERMESDGKAVVA